MRKLLAIILGAVMMLSLVIVGASAADPEVITTAEQFAAMTAGGNYKLGNDITVAASYADKFTGTFDGDGKKITTSVPLFADLSGTVKNLTIEGAVDGTNAQTGALASKSTDGCNVEKVTNNANVTVSADSFKGYRDGTYGAGFVAFATGECTFKDCVNNGSVTSETTHVSGFVGYADNVALTFTGCTNNGLVKNEKAKTRTGGFVGCDGKNNDGKTFTITLTNCKNTADITGGDQVGGLVGWTMSNVVVKNCSNSGKIVSTQNYAGGLVSRPGDDFSKTYADCPASTFTNCKNTGEVISFNSQAAGMASYVCTPIECTGCTNSGKITVDKNGEGTNGYAAGMIGKAAVAAAKHYVVCTDCTNTGEMYGGQVAAGICGSAGASKNDAGDKHYTFTNCKNTGKMTGVKTYAAGIIGYVYGDSGTGQYAVLDKCVNTGDLYGGKGAFVSNFVAYTNDQMTTIKNCIGSGKCYAIKEGETPYLVVFGCSSAGVSDGSTVSVCPIENNVLIENSGIEYYSYATAEANAVNIIKFEDYLAAHPTAFSIKTAAEINELLNPTTPTGPATPTGDTAVIVMIVCLVSLLGMGIALKARKA